jgi:hypothetical protein
MNRVSIALLGSALVLVAVLLMSAEPVVAHHGRGTTYESNREISIKGTVTKVYWRNPHISIFVDVKDATGKVTNWTIEHSPINRLARMGYTKNTVREGMEVTVVINPGSGGKPLGLCQKVILPDGTEVFDRELGDPDPLD